MVNIVDRNGKSTLIPDADMLADELRKLPAGKVADLAMVRRNMAQSHGAEMTCPVTVLRLLVQFSQESHAPYWRVVDANRPFARRLSGGGDRVREMLAREG